MRNHTVEIGDQHGRAFKMTISTPSSPGEVVSIFTNGLDMGQFQLLPGGGHYVSSAYPTGTWRSLDKGYIVHHTGRVVPARSHDGDSGRTTEDLYLESPGWGERVPIGGWGMKLFHYQDFMGVNDNGEGFVVQPWVLGFDAGRIEWSVVD